MDILIKGLEMPKNCLSCPMKEHCQLFNALHFNERLKMLDESIRVDGCPLVALPEHGRLCDLDSLIEHETYNIEQALFDSDEVLEDLKNAPVIVEATE